MNQSTNTLTRLLWNCRAPFLHCATKHGSHFSLMCLSELFSSNRQQPVIEQSTAASRWPASTLTSTSRVCLIKWKGFFFLNFSLVVRWTPTVCGLSLHRLRSVSFSDVQSVRTGRSLTRSAAVSLLCGSLALYEPACQDMKWPQTTLYRLAHVTANLISHCASVGVF